MTDARMLDLAVVAVYLLGTLALGARFLRSAGTAEGFTVGSRAVPTWAVGLSVLGTFVSSISFVGNPGKAYSDNWAPFLFALTVPLVAVLAGRLFVPLYRRRKDVSAYSFLEERFGWWARGYGSLSFQLLQLGRVSVILYLVALVIAPILGMTVSSIILVTGVLVTFYTMLGGIEAVIWTDVMQVIVMFGGALWCLALIVSLLPGGAAQAVNIALEAGGKFDLGQMQLGWGNQTFLGVLLFGVLANLQNFGVDQNYIQRYHTAKSEPEARRAIFIAALPFIPVTALFLSIGTGLFAFYRVFPERLPTGLAGDAVFPHFINKELPAGISGLLVAAILAAAMSTIASSINCMATVFVEDVYRRHFRPDLSDRAQVRLLRALTVAAGLAGTLLGLAMIGNRGGLDLFWQISATVGSGLLGLFLLAILPWRAERLAAQVAVAAAVAFVVWGTFWKRGELDPLLMGAMGTVMVIAGALAISGLMRAFRQS